MRYLARLLPYMSTHNEYELHSPATLELVSMTCVTVCNAWDMTIIWQPIVIGRGFNKSEGPLMLLYLSLLQHMIRR